MRMRDEQIDSLYHDYAYIALSRSDFRDHIEEAEHRAEQRVRAEIDDEVNKLRRENALARERVSQLFDSYDAYDRPCKQFVLHAIDAARETE